jgi:hypothetical protein
VAVVDDLHKLAALDVVFLTRTFAGTPGLPREVHRGRLHQALGGDWVFNASTGVNGVVGFMLGLVDNTWDSNETPDQGIVVTAPYPAGTPILFIALNSMIPTDFAD